MISSVINIGTHIYRNKILNNIHTSKSYSIFIEIVINVYLIEYNVSATFQDNEKKQLKFI